MLTKSHGGDGFCSITGGYVVRDPGLPTLAGRYLYGDFCAAALRSVDLANPGGDAATGLSVADLSSFGEDACGRILVVSLAGPVYRLVDGALSPCGAAGDGAAARRHAGVLGLGAGDRAAQRAAARAAVGRAAHRRGVPGDGAGVDPRRGAVPAHVAGRSSPGRRTRGLGAAHARAAPARCAARCAGTPRCASRCGCEAVDAAGNVRTAHPRRCG